MVRAGILQAFVATALVSASVLPVEHCRNASATISKRQQELKPMDSRALEDAIKEEALLQKARELQDAAFKSPMRNRVYGTPGHENTLQLIEKYLKTVEEHYTFARHEFGRDDDSYKYPEVNGTFSAAGKQYEIAFHQYDYSSSDSDPIHNVTGNIVLAANFGCNPSDFPSTSDSRSRNDTIALVHRGNCTFDEKLRAAAAYSYQVKAVVIVNNSTDPLLKAAELTTHGWPRKGSHPLIVTSQADGQALAAMAANVSLEGVLEMRPLRQRQRQKTYNLIVQTKQGDPNNVLVVGAHSDSVFAGPGINDNGSGLIAVLEAALQLPKYAVNNAVRFGFWSAEEVGLVGSHAYLEKLHDSAKDKIRLYLNFDMIASPNFVYGLYDGDASYDGHGLSHVDAELDQGSDHDSFMRECIPSGGIFTGAEDKMTEGEASKFSGRAEVAYDENYHGFGDTVENLNMTAFVNNAKAVAAAVAHFSTTFDTIPPRNRSCDYAREYQEDD
ncbi:Peptide hydrolase [Cercospora zeina]